jgi:hypothetical protein
MRMVHLGSFASNNNVGHVFLATITMEGLFQTANFPKQYTERVSINRFIIRTIPCHCHRACSGEKSEWD